MSDSRPRSAEPAGSVALRAVEASDSAAIVAALRLVDDAAVRDGVDPLNEQTRLDIAAGRRDVFVVTSAEHAVGVAVGASAHAPAEFDLVIAPAERERGFGRDAVAALVASFGDRAVTAWSHGDHPAARALATRYGFVRDRVLLRLRLDDLTGRGSRAVVAGRREADGVSIRSFDAALDEGAWVQLNSRIFAEHPEQGGMTRADLRDREAEEWFHSEDFLVAEHDGWMVGYDWLKIEPGADTGEIYVLGVDREFSGRGLGRALLARGLARIAERGCTRALLYVEADNVAAVGLYRSAGFVDDLVDAHYSRNR